MAIFDRYHESVLLGRRGFLGLGGLGLAALAAPAQGASRYPTLATPERFDDPFTLGVASGEPSPRGVVLWTRLAPEPLVPDGGVPKRRIPVQYEVAKDERFRRRVKTGVIHAVPELAHSVHVELSGLDPAHDYFYRFRVGRHISPMGRTRTTPAPTARQRQMRFAVCSCQDFTDGYYTAYQHMSEEDLDLVVHLGDYIYEVRRRGDVRTHVPDYEVTTLDDYRIRYALYKREPELRNAHAAFPWIVAVDDHEVENNWAGPHAQIENDRENDPERFLQRRAAAFQSFYEHLPLPLSSMPSGPDMQIYRRLTFGRLAQLNVLDTRQFRSNQVCGPPNDEPTREQSCPARFDPSRTMLGDEQEQWLLDGLASSEARWNVLANQVLMFQRDANNGAGEAFGMDHWDGYVAARDRLLDGIAERNVVNPVVLTADAHINYVADLKENFNEPDSATIATEFVATSISSNGDGMDQSEFDKGVLADNEHLHFSNRRRGYLRCVVDETLWRTDFRVVPFVSERGAPISTTATWVVEDGQPGAEPA